MKTSGARIARRRNHPVECTHAQMCSACTRYLQLKELRTTSHRFDPSISPASPTIRAVCSHHAWIALRGRIPAHARRQTTPLPHADADKSATAIHEPGGERCEGTVGHIRRPTINTFHGIRRTAVAGGSDTCVLLRHERAVPISRLLHHTFASASKRPLHSRARGAPLPWQTGAPSAPGAATSASTHNACLALPALPPEQPWPRLQAHAGALLEPPQQVPCFGQAHTTRALTDNFACATPGRIMSSRFPTAPWLAKYRRPTSPIAT